MKLVNSLQDTAASTQERRNLLFEQWVRVEKASLSASALALSQNSAHKCVPQFQQLSLFQKFQFSEKIDWNAAQILCSFLIDTVTSFRPVRRHSIKKNHKKKIIPYWFLLIKLICQTNTILIYSFICAMGKQSKCPSFDRERKLSRDCARLPHLCPGFPATQPSSVCVFFFVNFVLSYF